MNKYYGQLKELIITNNKIGLVHHCNHNHSEPQLKLYIISRSMPCEIVKY